MFDARKEKRGGEVLERKGERREREEEEGVMTR